MAEAKVERAKVAEAKKAKIAAARQQTLVNSLDERERECVKA